MRASIASSSLFASVPNLYVAYMVESKPDDLNSEQSIGIPNKALNSLANLEEPQPLSLAACATAIELGIISTRISKSLIISILCLFLTFR